MTRLRAFQRLAPPLSHLALIIGLAGCAAAPAERVVEVTGTDFAFVAPDTLSPGATRFRFRRTGTVAHEVAIARVKRGVPLAQVLSAEARGDDTQALYDEGAGLLYAAITEQAEAELLVDLEPGRQYVLACTLDENGKPHAMLGMVKAITVRER